MKKDRIFLSIYLLFVSALNLHAQNRGGELEALVGNVTVGKQWAVFIAIDAYRLWPALKKPVADAREIRKILEEDYYLDKEEIIELYNQNATKEKIIETFENLQKKLTVHDSLFIYYAGHGHLDEASGQGFWIPADGGTNRRAQENWLPNNQIRGYIAGLKTIHVFLVSDACFSGDILNTTRALPPQIDNTYYRNAYRLTSRQVLTSGSSETVPDQSEFSEALKNCLRKNTAPLLDPISIYNDVRLSVQSTLPLYGTLNQASHQDGATFLFFRKQAAVSPPPSTPQPAPAPQPALQPVVTPAPNPAPQPETSVKREETWKWFKEAAYLRMVQCGSFVYQSDNDFSYIFDEAGMRWSFLPFTSVGFDLAFGGNTEEPVSYSRGRAAELKAMGLKEEDEQPVFYGYADMSIGFVIPLTKKETTVRFHLFGDGLIQFGTAVYPGLFADFITPGFDVGISMALPGFFIGWGLNIKYKSLWYQNPWHTNGIIIGLTVCF